MTATERRQFSLTALELHALARIHERAGDEFNKTLARSLRTVADQAAALESLSRSIQEAERVGA